MYYCWIVENCWKINLATEAFNLVKSDRLLTIIMKGDQLKFNHFTTYHISTEYLHKRRVYPKIGTTYFEGDNIVVGSK